MKKYNKWAALFGGWFGLHYYLVGETSMGLLYTFTFGVFGIGWIVDIVRSFTKKTKHSAITIFSLRLPKTFVIVFLITFLICISAILNSIGKWKFTDCLTFFAFICVLPSMCTYYVCALSDSSYKTVFTQNKFINFLFPFPSIILTIFFLILSFLVQNEDGTESAIGTKIIFFIFCFIFFVLPVDIICLIVKIVSKKSGKKQPTKEEVQLVQSKIEYCQKLADTINTTTNRIDFYLALEEVKKTLKELIAYEGKIPFVKNPSDNLKHILENEEKTITLFEERFIG